MDGETMSKENMSIRRQHSSQDRSWKEGSESGIGMVGGDDDNDNDGCAYLTLREKVDLQGSFMTFP